MDFNVFWGVTFTQHVFYKKRKRKRVASSNSLVTSSNLRVTSSQPRVRGLKPPVTTLKTRVGRSKAWDESIKPRVKRKTPS